MRVAFDSRPAEDLRGIGRYVRCLLPALREAGRGEVVEAARARRADVFHSPWIDGAPLRPRRPTVVTLHDVVPLKRQSEYLRTGLRFRFAYLRVTRATRVIVPTQVVAEEAGDLLGLERECVDVIHEAPAAIFEPQPDDVVASVRERHALPERYLLWVGGLETPDPRKRVAALAATPHELPLVLVGRSGAWARELEDVHLTGEVSDPDLAAIYAGAHALVCPSDDEGFGLPPVEALACGTPVVACDVPALREVLGERATFVELDDLPGLVRAAEALEGSAPPAPAWTWADAAQATWDSYQRALDAT